MYNSDRTKVVCKYPYISDKEMPLLKVNKSTNEAYIENNQKQLDLFNNVICKDFIDRVKDSRYI